MPLGEALYHNSREVSCSLCTGFILFTGGPQLFQTPVSYGEETVKNWCIFVGWGSKGQRAGIIRGAVRF